MLDVLLSRYPSRFRSLRLPKEVEHEAKRRIVDAIGCFYGAFNEKQVASLRRTLLQNQSGPFSVWGNARGASPEIAAWVNGTGVRALDYNDTYLSKEPCHPSDMLASLWAAAQLSGSRHQGRDVVRAMVLSYEVLCRLCDAASLRARGWDHVTYLPVSTAIGCSYILGLTPEQTRHAIALSVVGNNALRQTRVGSISDWKAACASYAARAGLLATMLAKGGFTGPSDIFTGRHGFEAQVSGPLRFNTKPLGRSWKIMETHTKFYPAEHHAQSAIEAALSLRPHIGRRPVKKIVIESFKAAVEIIGSEKEKWMPTTRETADHSMPYLVVAALLDGNVTLDQFRKKRYLDRDVRTLLKNTSVVESPKYTKIYPKFLPNAVRVHLKDGSVHRREVLLPKGYAGRAMTDGEIEAKFRKNTAALGKSFSERVLKSLWTIDHEKLPRV
jgi:2-methylcitrate dehydratase